jgi:D-alanine---D-serine ligase
MKRKRMTQIFPCLLPLRRKQRLFLFYLKMRFDKKRYAVDKKEAALPYQIFETESNLYNYETGFDMKYQENKVFNLKLAANMLDNLIIKPGEIFSFWKLVRYADRFTAYKDGLVVVDGKLTTAYGGGLCQISNLLFWMFLHTPLTIVERHGHSVKDFPDPPSELPIGIDANIAEGWFDLKVKNNTNITFQISLVFEEEQMIGKVFTDKDIRFSYQIKNRDIHYERKKDEVFQKTDVCQLLLSKSTGELMNEKLLYQNICKIGYSLPEEFLTLGNEEENMRKIAIIFGGCSSEYEVSLQSAVGVINNIDKNRYEPILIGIDRQGRWFLYEGKEENILNDTWNQEAQLYPVAVSTDQQLHGIFVWRNGFVGKVEQMSLNGAFPILHGKNGEDGTVQGMLTLANIPVIGCNILSSAVCMDKDMAHRIVKEAGIFVPKSKLVSSTEWEQAKEEVYTFGEMVRYPVFVKPLRAGSSYGITKVEQAELLEEALELAFTYDNQAIVEEMIDGFEVGCAVMGKEELTIGEVDEIELSEGFFDYTEKYTLKTSKIHVPARISEEKALEIKEAAVKIYKSLGCEWFARVDLFLTLDGKIYFNEVNTIPGFTEHSRFPNMMRCAGVSMKEIVNNLIEMVVK